MLCLSALLWAVSARGSDDVPSRYQHWLADDTPTLVWTVNCGASGSFGRCVERDWVREEILSEVPLLEELTIREQMGDAWTGKEPLINNSIIFYGDNGVPPEHPSHIHHYLWRLAGANLTFSILHFADELEKADVSHYPSCRLVIRPHARREFLGAPNILQVDMVSDAG